MKNHNAEFTRFADIVPAGLLFDRQWLKQQGFARPDVDYYLRSGGLQAIVRGVYRRPGRALKWQSILYSLQQCGYRLHVGGAWALAEQGYSHFISLIGPTAIQLYSADKLPAWLSDWHMHQPLPQESFYFNLHQQPWLQSLPEELFQQQAFGQWDWLLSFACVELAVFEILVELKTESEFSQLDRWFESLSNLSPTKLQTLLVMCPNIKAKRLFGWFAERHNHAWYKKLDWSGIDLGSGKRALIAGGSFNKQWQITVPRMMEQEALDGSQQPLF